MTYLKCALLALAIAAASCHTAGAAVGVPVSTLQEFQTALATAKVIQLTDHILVEGSLMFPSRKNVAIYGNCSNPDALIGRAESLIDKPIPKGACGLTFGQEGYFYFEKPGNTDASDSAMRAANWRYYFMSNLIMHKTGLSNKTNDFTTDYITLFMSNVEYSGFKSFNLWDASIYFSQSTIAEVVEGISITICKPDPENAVALFNHVNFVQNGKNYYVSTRTGYDYTANLFLGDVSYSNKQGALTEISAVELKPGSQLNVYLGPSDSFGAARIPENWAANETYNPPGGKPAFVLHSNAAINLDAPDPNGLHTPSDYTINWLAGLMNYNVPGVADAMVPFFSDFPPPPPPSPPTSSSGIKDTSPAPNTTVKASPPTAKTPPSPTSSSSTLRIIIAAYLGALATLVLL